MESWWNEFNQLERISHFSEITEECLENLADYESIDLGLPVCRQARHIIGLIALASVSQEWLNQYYNPDSSFHQMPLQFVAGIEIVTASLADIPASLKKPVIGANIQSDRLILIEKKTLDNKQNHSLSIPEPGWLPDPTTNEAGAVIWKQLFEEGKKTLSPTDWRYLATVCRGKKKYLAVDCSNQSGHPFQDDRICELLHQKLQGVNIVRFGLFEIEGTASPLIVDEGDLIGEIWLFLEMIEKYENP